MGRPERMASGSQPQRRAVAEEEPAILTAEDASGRAENVSITVTGERPYELTLSREDQPAERFGGDNLFPCLLSVRERLEADGLLLCCQGARLDVTNTGLLKQMTDGKYVYTFDPDARTINEETVYALDPAPFEIVGSVAAHRSAIFALFGLRDRYSETGDGG
jgi:hypothetical protein